MFVNKEAREQRCLEAHQRWCEMVTEEAQDTRTRTLTEAERHAIRDITSFLFLQMCEPDLCATRTREEAEQWLVKLIKTSQERGERKKGLLGHTEAGQ